METNLSGFQVVARIHSINVFFGNQLLGAESFQQPLGLENRKQRCEDSSLAVSQLQ